MIDRQTDLAQDILKNYWRINEAAKKLEVRIYQYKGYAKSSQAICDANDAVYEIQRQIKKLKEALNEM